MNALRRAVNNIVMLLSGQLIIWASTLVLAAAYGRFLGSTGFGELYLATTFTALIGFPIEFSFNQQIVRDVAQAPQTAYRYITMGVALKFALWIVLYALALVLSILLGYTPEVRLLIAITGLMLMTAAVSGTLTSVQNAYMQSGPAKIGAVIEKLADTVIAVILLRSGAGVIPVALTLLFGSFVGMAWQVLQVAHTIGIRFEWDTAVARSMIRSGMAFLASGVIGVLYYRIDTVLLSIFTTAATIGIYGAAYRLFDTLVAIPGIIIGAVMAPILAKYSIDPDKNRLRIAVEKSTTAMLLCSVPAAAGLIVVAPNIIMFVYHRQDFTGSEAILQALGLGLVALFLNSVLGAVLISTGQERKLPFMATAALIFNLAVNLILIPRYMGLGAAWATSLTEVLLLGISLALVDRSLIPTHLWVTAAKIIAASVVMAIVAHALDTYNILVIIPIAVVVYVIAVWALRILPQEDIEHFRPIIARFTRLIPLRAIAQVFDRPETQAVPEFASVGASGLELVAPSQPVSALTGSTARDQSTISQAEVITSASLHLTASDTPSTYERVTLNFPAHSPMQTRRDLVPSPFPRREQNIPVIQLRMQRRMQRRIARLDTGQIMAALARGQLGNLALRLHHIEPRTFSQIANRRHSSKDRELAALHLQQLMSQAGCLPTADGIVRIGGGSPGPDTFYLEIHRQRPMKRSRNNRGCRSCREKSSTVGAVSHPGRPLRITSPRSLKWQAHQQPSGDRPSVSRRRASADDMLVSVKSELAEA